MAEAEVPGKAELRNEVEALEPKAEPEPDILTGWEGELLGKGVVDWFVSGENRLPFIWVDSVRVLHRGDLPKHMIRLCHGA